MAQLKDLIVNGPSRFIGDVYATTFTGNLAGNATSATSASSVSWSGITNIPITIGTDGGGLYLEHSNANGIRIQYKNTSDNKYYGFWMTDATPKFYSAGTQYTIYHTGNLSPITTSNIGSQSVNYATSAGSASSAGVATNASNLYSGAYINGSNADGIANAPYFIMHWPNRTWADVIFDGTFKVLGHSSDRSGSYVPAAFGTTTVNGKLHTDCIGHSSNYLVKPVADYRTKDNIHTGCITITLPSDIGNTMVSMWIDVYLYTTNQSFSVHCGGYAYTNSSWQYNPFAMVYGANHRVRFGHNGTSFVIYIGETDSSWSYPQVSVRDVTIGYDKNYDKWSNAWSIGFSTSISNVTADITHFAYTTKNLPSSFPANGGTSSYTNYLNVVASNEIRMNRNGSSYYASGASSPLYINYSWSEGRIGSISSYYFQNGGGAFTSLTASGFVKNGSTSGYVLTGDGGHAAISGLSVNYASSAGSCSGSSGYTTKFSSSGEISNVNSPSWNDNNVTYNTFSASASNKPYDGNNANGVLNVSFGKHGTNGTYGYQLAHGNSSQRLYFRQWTAGSISNWYTIAYTSDIPSLTNYYTKTEIDNMKRTVYIGSAVPASASRYSNGDIYLVN